MKTNLNLILSLLLSAVVISCDRGERIREISDKDINETYEKRFREATKGYSASNSWNLARAYSLDIAPEDDTVVKIYAPCKDEYRLVAHYSKATAPFTANFDAPASATDFVVALGDELYSVNPGGRVTPHSAKANDVKVSDIPFQWILAVENIFDAEKKENRDESQIDLDFNDVLIAIRSVVTNDGVSLDLIPLACGDNQPFYLHIKTDESDQLLWQSNTEFSNDCEFHQWFGVKDYSKGVNTGVNAPGQTSSGSHLFTIEAFAHTISGCHLDLPSYWTLSNYSYQSRDYKGNVTDVWGIYLTIGTYKNWDFVRNNSDYGLICSKDYGSAPQMLLFPDIGVDGKWRWPVEGNSLIDCYPLFVEWANNSENEYYKVWYEWAVINGTTRIRY